jgi:hypothetical protein
MKLLYSITFILSLLAFSNYSYGQPYKGLQTLNHKGVSLHYSKGQEARSAALATLVEKAIDFNYGLLGFKPQVTVLVLSPEDWKAHTSFPVYGMPHYKDDKTLVVASSDNDFWRSFTPPIHNLPASFAEEVKTAYRTGDGKLSMQPFFDLLAIHELGHAFHLQGGLTMQRKWMGELFCNVLLHTYIAENEPHLLPALTLFPRMVVNGGAGGFQFTNLEQFENNYSEIGQQHPKNYGWYQSRFHVAAQQIYDAGGKEALLNLWQALQNKLPLSDEEFASLLQKNVHTSVADVLLKW